MLLLLLLLLCTDSSTDRTGAGGRCGGRRGEAVRKNTLKGTVFRNLAAKRQTYHIWENLLSLVSLKNILNISWCVMYIKNKYFIFLYIFIMFISNIYLFLGRNSGNGARRQHHQGP